MFGKLLHWLRNPVSSVPEGIAVCEFDCTKTECIQGDWNQCERRLKVCASKQQEERLDN